MYMSQKITTRKMAGILTLGLLLSSFAQAQENPLPQPQGESQQVEQKQEKAEVRTEAKAVRKEQKKNRHMKRKGRKEQPSSAQAASPVKVNN